MALHGTIQVNDSLIGHWEAIRQRSGNPAAYRYKCRVLYRRIHTDRIDDFDFEVVHNYDDGALVLIHKIFEKVVEWEALNGAADQEDRSLGETSVKQGRESEVPDLLQGHDSRESDRELSDSAGDHEL